MHNRRKNILIAILVGIVLGSVVGLLFASEGSITNAWVTQGFPTKHTITWTASTNGVVVAVTNSAYDRGTIKRAVITCAPTGATYGITLKDGSGVDILGGQCSALTSNAVVSLVPGEAFTDGVITSVAPFVVNDQLVVDVNGVGSNKTGSVILYEE